MERRVIVTNRDCPARLVPTGDPITIPDGTFVTLTQNLGGTFTVVHKGNMARVSGEDGDALGLTVDLITFPPSDSDQVDKAQVSAALESVYDPEIPVNIVDLGLVYNIAITEGTVNIEMTLTAPGCGMGPVLVQDVKDRVARVPNVHQVNVELVFDPPWSRDMMTEEAQLELGVF